MVGKLKRIIWVDRNGRHGEEKGKGEIFQVRRGGKAVAEQYISQKNAEFVYLELEDGTGFYYNKNGRMAQPPQVLAYIVDNEYRAGSRGKRR